MTARKHQVKKTTGQKKVISAVSKAHQVNEASSMSAPKGTEDAIVKQFHRIQRGYSILMGEVVKEYDLIKEWIGDQASNRTEEIKQKIAGIIPHF